MKTYNVNLTIDNDQLEPSFEQCPFCGSTTKPKYIGKLQDQPSIDALECVDCHLGYADRQPTAAFLTDYYTNYFDDTRHTTIKKELLIGHLMGHFAGLTLEKTCNLVDFGGGDGSIGHGVAEQLLQTHPQTRFNLYVVDPNSGGLDNQHANITVHNFTALEALDNSIEMDVVIASAILEHVKDPRDSLTRLLHMLKPQGQFYARTPYIFPFKWWLDRLGWRLDIGYPGHLFDMGSKFWNKVLMTLGEQDGFDIKVSKTSLVETTFKEWFSRTLIAHVFKFPSRFLGSHYHFVGGWELVIQRK